MWNGNPLPQGLETGGTPSESNSSNRFPRRARFGRTYRISAKRGCFSLVAVTLVATKAAPQSQSIESSRPTAEAGRPPIKKWRTQEEALYYGGGPPPGSTEVGEVQGLGNVSSSDMTKEHEEALQREETESQVLQRERRGKQAEDANQDGRQKHGAKPISETLSTVGGSAKPAPAPNGGDALLAASDLKYEGYFNIPPGSGSYCAQRAYSFGAIAYRASDASLFITSHAYCNRAVAQFRVPSDLSGNSTAALIKSQWGTIPPATGSSAVQTRVRGILWDEAHDRLCWTQHLWYNVSAKDIPDAGCIHEDGSIDGPYEVGFNNRIAGPLMRGPTARCSFSSRPPRARPIRTTAPARTSWICRPALRRQ